MIQIAARTQRLFIVADDFNAGPQVSRHRIRRPGGDGNLHSVSPMHETPEVLDKQFTSRLELADDLLDLRRQRLQFAANRFRQRAQEFADLLGAKTGHRPLDHRGRGGCRQRERQLDRHAIVFLARRIGVSERDRLPPDRHGVREGAGVVAEILFAHQFLLRHAQRTGLRVLAQPAIQIVGRRHILQALRVEVAERLIKIDESVMADARLPVFNLLPHRAVVVQERID